MSKRPTPVIVISGRTGEEDVFRALELGAVDFVAKPSPRATPELNGIEQELVRKVHAVRDLRIDKVQTRIDATPAAVQAEGSPRLSTPGVVVIGSSTGGPAALMQIFSAFSEAPQCSFVVAQHMPAGFTRGFAERIDRLTRLRAVEAEGGEPLSRGMVLIAPGGKHLEFESFRGRVVTKLIASSDQDKYTPSVDRLFESAAKHLGSDLLAVVLTGMGDDGRSGVRSVNLAGGNVIAESESTAVIFGMPQQAIRTGLVDQVLPLGEIATAIQVGFQASPRREQSQEGTS
jgi:two-component system chemotaxis response regulator CheB